MEESAEYAMSDGRGSECESLYLSHWESLTLADCKKRKINSTKSIQSLQKLQLLVNSHVKMEFGVMCSGC